MEKYKIIWHIDGIIETKYEAVDLDDALEQDRKHNYKKENYGELKNLDIDMDDGVLEVRNSHGDIICDRNDGEMPNPNNDGKFIVEWKITGTWETEVEADNYKNAIHKSYEIRKNANFGNLRKIGWQGTTEPCIVKDKNNKTIWKNEDIEYFNMKKLA